MYFTITIRGINSLQWQHGIRSSRETVLLLGGQSTCTGRRRSSWHDRPQPSISASKERGTRVFVRSEELWTESTGGPIATRNLFQQFPAPAQRSPSHWMRHHRTTFEGCHKSELPLDSPRISMRKIVGKECRASRRSRSNVRLLVVIVNVQGRRAFA